MQITLSVIKADIGSIGGHIAPSARLLDTVRAYVVDKGAGLLLDSRISHTGDDIAILMTHTQGVKDERIHRLAWDAFSAGIATAKQQGLYGTGRGLLQDAFSGNVQDMGPAVAEMSFDERPNEPFVLFAADNTDPGAFNLPLYLAFADPMNTPGLSLSPQLSQGFRFVVMDVKHTAGDRVIELNTPEDLYDLAALLRDPDRYVVDSIWSRATGEQAVATSRQYPIADKRAGKGSPVMLVRVHTHFPATGEVLAPFSIGPYVAGGMRGTHQMPLMPVPLDSGISYFDGPPIVSCAAYAMHAGKLTEALDAFAHPFWDTVRHHVADKAMDMRRQGFVGTAMLPMSESEYTGIGEKLAEMDRRFTLRGV